MKSKSTVVAPPKVHGLRDNYRLSREQYEAALAQIARDWLLRVAADAALPSWIAQQRPKSRTTQ